MFFKHRGDATKMLRPEIKKLLAAVMLTELRKTQKYPYFCFFVTVAYPTTVGMVSSCLHLPLPVKHVYF